MAGAGYKLFNTGDVLTAAQVNTYLMEQTIMVFANATARDTALSGVLAQGMQCFLKDTNTMQYYSGSAWVTLSTGGDITSVVAGTGLSGGGTSGDVTLNLSTPVSATNGGTAQTTYATGDILYASASNTLAKRSIGTTGQVLTVSGGVPTWAAAAGGGKVLQIVTASYATEVNTTSTSYSDLGLSCSITPSASTSKVLVMGQLNGNKTGTDTSLGVMAKMLRGASDIFQIAQAAGYTNTNSRNNQMIPFFYLDEPATTSATTYKIQVASNISGQNVQFHFQYSGTIASSRIFLVEIGA